MLFIVVNTKNDTIKQIDVCCTEIYETKLKALSMTSERDHPQKSKECILTKDNDYLKELNNYLPNLLTYLWENPKLVSIVLSNSDIKDIKDNLAPLIVNNFYENILSSNYIEDNLMYVLGLLLKEEINTLGDINNPESFLDESSVCGYLLSELRRKNDVQYFFKTLILNVINDLEVISSKTFTLEIKEIKDKYNNNKESKDKEDKSKSSSKNKSINTEYLYQRHLDNSNDSSNLNYEELKLKQSTEKEKAKLDEFSEKYMPLLSLAEIKKMINESYADNINMKNYCYNQLVNCENEKDDNYYSNKKFMDILYNMNESREILYLYLTDFSTIIDFIEQILSNLKTNLYLLPYSVKCLCKIISILIEKKFPKINATQKNAYIAAFFFQKLLMPILTNPGLGVLINNFIISDNTLKNLKIINKILGQLVSGKFFKDSDNSDYTSFNWYFLEKMPEILEIFQKVTKVTLPHFIEELLYDKLGESYQYDYFRENPDEVMYHRSICFNLFNINSLLNSLEKCKDKIYTDDMPGKIFKKTLEKLNSNKNRKLINDLLKNSKDADYDCSRDAKNRKSVKQKDRGNNESSKEKINYFLITSFLANDKYKEVFDLQLDNNPSYTIKELKKTNDAKDIINNNVIKVKNFIISLLYNYRKLIITDFDEGAMSNTINILKKLKTYIKSSNYVVDDSIPSEWYIDSLIEYLDKIPEEYIKDDFKILYDEIENELNSAIKRLDFEVLSVCLNKLKYTKRGKNYYKEAIKSTKELELNEKVKKIIEGEYIPVEIIFKYHKEKIFDIVKSKIKEKEYLKNKVKTNKDFCHNIREFTEKFPDLSIFQEKQDIDIFDLQKELLIPEKIEEYFHTIKDSLLSNKKYSSLSETEMQEINDKINDYVMCKIYDKIFPKTNCQDDKIFNKSVMISWTEPKHFIPGKTNYVFDSFLPGVIDCFKSMDTEKSTRKKILYMNDIFSSISKVVKFNGGDENTGVDDQMPILNYAFVKAQPNRIYSNIKLLELYLGDMGSKKEGSQLTQLIAACDFIINLRYDNLNGVTKEEFNRKCTYAASGKIPS